MLAIFVLAIACILGIGDQPAEVKAQQVAATAGVFFPPLLIPVVYCDKNLCSRKD